MKKNTHPQKGMGMIEVIVCLTIITISFWTFLELAKYNLRVQEQTNAKMTALNLASETLEAVRSIRDEDWDNLAFLSLGTKYYPIISANKWTLTSINPGSINGIYDRWVVLEKVYRDANNDISPSGMEDIQTKKITALVEWIDHGQTKQIDLITYLTNWVD
ncbi:MAG: hypothetical protein ISS88_00305 [Candidatus Portnoybacteria bacterium]|nr:hypothetical protein [Candidatus Portnoybacteria bacterium]